MKTLTTEQIEILKSYQWETSGNFEGFTLNEISQEQFQKVTGYDLVALLSLKGAECSLGWSLEYGRKVNWSTDGDNNFVLRSIVYIGGSVFYQDFINESETDFLGLFPQEKTEEKSTKEKLIECINNYCDENTRSAFIDLLGDEFPGLWEDILDIARENLDTENTAKQWIDDNNGDAIDYVFSNCDTYDLKDCVVDYIRDNL